ncbi:MAG: hypothetical protein ACRCWI_07265 [Brevinema sp.]
MFRKNNSGAFVSFLKGITDQQSRALLLTGVPGCGKTACALDLAEFILKENPLTSSNLFYFRNDHWSLKADFFLKKNPASMEAWTWLYLLQRRIGIILAIDENISSEIKLSSLKNQLDELINNHVFPQDFKLIDQLVQLALVLDKKSGLPINVIREAITFHSAKSVGRVSILSDFDLADPTTQNSALKLLEEPYPNHWLILTAQTEKTILPTILSRTLKIPIKKPLDAELEFLGGIYGTSIEIMSESVYELSSKKIQLLQEFFTHCSPKIEFGISFVQFAEMLAKQGQSILFLEELIKCLEDGLRQRQSQLRAIDISLKYPQYQQFSALFSKITTAELEELVQQVESLFVHIRRSVIKDEYLLPNFLLDLSRILRRNS